MLVDCYAREDVFAQVPELAAEIDPVLKKLDGLLEDDQFYQQVRADFGKRHRYTLVHGRHSTPIEVLLRMLILKYLYQWSYKELERRVKDSLVLRWFCRVAFHAVPDDSTLWRWEQTLRSETVHALNDRVVQLAKQAKVTKGRKLRLDATCVQTEIHHPTDSGRHGRQRTCALPLCAAGQRTGQRSGEQRAAGLSLAAAHGAAGGPNPAPATATQSRGQRSASRRNCIKNSSRRPSTWCAKVSR